MTGHEVVILVGELRLLQIDQPVNTTLIPVPAALMVNEFSVSVNEYENQVIYKSAKFWPPVIAGGVISV